MSIGHCNALKRACETEAFKKFFNRLIFDNCGIDDEEFATIISGIKAMHEFKKIVYRHNSFGKNSLMEIQDLVFKRKPHHLEELRIEHCKIDPSITRGLLQVLVENSHLKKLGLVATHLIEDSFVILCKYLEQSSNLIEIDISWNKLKPVSFIKFLALLAENNKLQYLNLSFNQLLEDQRNLELKKEQEKQKVKMELKHLATMNVYVPQASQSSLSDKDMADTFGDELTPNAKHAIENLSKFIKKDPVLIHVDLTNCGLNEKQLWYFGKTLRRSKSLRALHLCGNVGITGRVLNYLSDRAHCIQDGGIINNMEIYMLPSALKEVKTEEEDKETALVKHIKQHKRNETSGNDAIIDENKKTLIFSRFLGHKEDIPGSGQWRMITS